MSGEIKPDVEIILHGVKCPKNFVMVKLQLEDMLPGQVLSIELDEGVPARNVHKSLMMEPVEILDRTETAKGVRLVVKKK